MRRIFSTSSIGIAMLAGLMLGACGNKPVTKAEEQPKPVPTEHHVTFNADSAYGFVAAQVAFGPRVPNTQAHRDCGEWLVGKLNAYGASRVTSQHTQVMAYDGTPLDVQNISASFNPDANKRILLLAHWDSRPWADQDPVVSRRDRPIDGANDGASGVGVILEVARLVSQTSPKVGVDVLFVDAEDWGGRADKHTDSDEMSWCLGTQYWVKNPTLDLDKIRYAILLDMVGGKDAVFPREYFSQQRAAEINDKVWRMAQNSGFSGRFIDQVGTPVVDDHIHLLRAGIPAIDIIENNNPKTNSFNPTWHTHDDTIENIDQATLGIVGQTLVNLIYSE